MLDSLIEAVISIVRDRLKSSSTPKARAVRALVELHSAMVECHESYQALKSSTSEPRTVREWRRAVDRLLEVSKKLRSKLDIADPDVSQAVHGYFSIEVETLRRYEASWDESWLAVYFNTAESILKEKNDSDGSQDDGSVPQLLNEYGAIDAPDFAEYDDAIAKLRTFIMANFTWEDLFE